MVRPMMGKRFLGGGERKKKKTLGGPMQIIKNNNGTFYKILVILSPIND
jgi:hypothetical protein